MPRISNGMATFSSGGKLRQQIMKLPDKPKLPAAKLRCIFFRETYQLELGEVYVTFGSAIKHSEYVKQGTFSGTRLANNGQHLAGLHLNDKFSKSTKSELPERNTFFRLCARNNTS